MSEFEDKLNTLLSNPDAMAQVMQLAQSLSQSSGTESGTAPPPPAGGAPNVGDTAGAGGRPNRNAAPDMGAAPQTDSVPNLGALPNAGELNALLSQFTGGLDPALLARLLPVVGQLNRPESSETSALLYALQPFLRDKRRDKVARAAQLAKLIHLAKVFLTTREG